jgi:hypothetical protein
MAYRTINYHELYEPHTEYPACDIDFCQLPSKYDVDIELLRTEITKKLKHHKMIEYPIPSTVPMAEGGKIATFPGYEGICFKAKVNSQDPLYEGLGSNSLKALRRREDCIDTEYTEKTELWFPYLDEIVNKFNGQVTQIRLICLRAGYNLGEKQHLDYPWYKGIRMHIPLTPDVEYIWNVLGVNYTVHGHQPHMYYLDTGKPHDARNKQGKKDRYLLNINMVPARTDIPIQDQIKQQIL